MENQNNNVTYTGSPSKQEAFLKPQELPEGCPFFEKMNNQKEVSLENNSDWKSEGHEYLKKTTKKDTHQKSKAEKPKKLGVAIYEGIKELHSEATSSLFTKLFVKGRIGADEYGCYLNSLYFIYNTMESLLEEHKQNAAVQLIHFPEELNRKEFILKDLAFFYEEDQLENLTNPRNMITTVKKYVSAMKEASEKNPVLLIAHSYSRYLGDLNGGPILSKSLKKNILKYNAHTSLWDSTEGSSFYQFNKLGNEDEFKRIYRERLNSTNLDAETQDMVIKEAAKSIELNIAMFNEIIEISEAGQLASTRVENESSSGYLKKPKSSERDWHLWKYAVTILVVVLGMKVYGRYSK